MLMDDLPLLSLPTSAWAVCFCGIKQLVGKKKKEKKKVAIAFCNTSRLLLTSPSELSNQFFQSESWHKRVLSYQVEAL